MDNTNKSIIPKCIYSFLCFALIVLAICVQEHIHLSVLITAILCFTILNILLLVFNNEKTAVLSKLAMLAIALLSVAFVGYVAFYSTGLITNLKDIEAITEFVRGTKHWGIIVYIVIVIFQVLFLPIPGIIPAILGTALYGAWWAFVFMSIGTIAGSILTFALGKIFGRKLVVWMIGEEKTNKYASIINDKGRFVFIVMLLFPFFPDDILCLVAGVTNMSYKYFIISVSLTRPVMNAFYCFFGTGQIIPFSGWGIPVWIVLFVAAILLLVLLHKLKGKTSSKLLKDKNNIIK